MKPIYLDYAASTPIDPRVAQDMLACMTMQGVFANPASLHPYGRAAREAVERAREQVAALISAEASEIVWTSGATEANNLAIKGAARLYKRRGQHIITVKTEHKAVLDPCQQLEKEGYQVTYLTPNAHGLVEKEQVLAAIRNDTVLISMMHVNNELGVIQDIAAIATLTSERGILLHVDAAQSTGKLALDLQTLPIDLMSLAAHKTYGPKGIGALYLRKRPRVRVEPLIHGGGHEQGMRSGTLATHQIVGMGSAFALAAKEQSQDYAHVTNLRQKFLAGISTIQNLQLNSTEGYTVPHILNVRFEGMLAEAILAELPGIATSTASACQGKGTEGSYVLRALGLTEAQAKSSVRFSFGRFTTLEEIMSAVQQINQLFKASVFS